MTEKRFKLAFEDFDGWAILDTTGKYSNDEDYIDWLSGQKAVDVMNHFAEESKHLKQALLFFLDYAHMSEKQRFEYNYKTGRICDNESNFQCTSNMLHIVRRLNDIDKKCKQLQSENEELKHQLNTLNGLYASDQEDMSKPFRLEFKKL